MREQARVVPSGVKVEWKNLERREDCAHRALATCSVLRVGELNPNEEL